jgi:hypothetical protein
MADPGKGPAGRQSRFPRLSPPIAARTIEIGGAAILLPYLGGLRSFEMILGKWPREHMGFSVKLIAEMCI